MQHVAGTNRVPIRTYRQTAVLHAIRMDEDFEVHTIGGVIKGRKGDWLVQGTLGESYPISHKVFAQQYEEIADVAK